MAKCPNCKSTNYVHKCMECGESETPKAKKGVVPCEWPCMATIHIQESQTGRPVQGIFTRLDGVSAETDVNGFRIVEKLKPGNHVAAIVEATLGERYTYPIGDNGAAVTKPIAAGDNQFFTFILDPLRPLKVVVKRRHDSKGLGTAKVTVAAGKAGNTVAPSELTTPISGDVTFKKLRQDAYKVSVELDAPGKKKYELEKAEDHHNLDMSQNPNELIVWARLVVHLKLKYVCPDAQTRPFPKDFPLTVVFDDNTTKDLKILDDAGYFKFAIEDDKKTKFTLKFDHAKTRYLVHEKDKPAAELQEDLDDDKLNALNDAGKQFFALPKTWSLLQSTWDATNVVVPQDGQIVIPDGGIGASDAPAELTLKPKLQYARFQFFDRKYCEKDHSKKQVSIPPVVLKGVRESAADATGTPQNPVAGTHDAISNWFVDKDDAEKACQCLPWIITKKAADGADLPKLNNKLLLEFGRENAFVHSASATARKLVVLAANDDKRKPNRDRNQYYDLPKQWKSKFYFTRFSDPAKNKFFDELAVADDPDLEASFTKDTKLSFSLDDIVLATGAAQPFSQTVKDKDETDTDQDLSEHSRFTILMLDPKDDKYKVAVHKPHVKTAYWSDVGFQKEVAGVVRRNAIVELPINPRVVVFCDGFYDVHDKRTESADFTKKEILGARAAKLEDTTISSVKTVFENDGDVTNHYVHLKRKFHMHYLHYAATDGTTVYGLLVTMWTCRFKKDGPKGGTDDVVTKFREEGMKRAMDRWNEKDYFFEEADDKHEVVIKHFCLFEAKDVETSTGVFTKRGGKHICEVTVKDDENGGSSAAANGLTMVMRRSGALDEGDGWGHDSWADGGPGTEPLPPITEYDVVNAAPCNAFAHELGHAAIGAWDDYVTGKFVYLKASGASTKLWMYNDKNESMDIEGQRYYGMPFEVDKGAIMTSNRAARMRYFWGRANWLNDQAKVALDPLLAKRRFRIGYVPKDATKGKLKFSKPDKAEYRSIYKPIKSTKPYALDKKGRCDLHLYHLGQDELTQTLDGGPYTGILAVCLKLSARFLTPAWAVNTAYKVDQVVKRDGKLYKCKTDHTPVPVLPANTDPPISLAQWDKISDVDDKPEWASGTAYIIGDKVNRAGAQYECKRAHTAGAAGGSVPAMADRDWIYKRVDAFTTMRISHLENLNQHIVTMLQDRFKLQGNGNFSTTYIRIFPQWEIVEPGVAATPGAHFELEFTFGADTLTLADNKISAGTKCKPKAIVRYMFGKIGESSAQWAAEGGEDGDLTKDDLPKIKSWMDTNADGRFNVGII